MSTIDRINSVFTKPWQWGLRGDPFLWNELRDHFSTVGLPATSEAFVQQVELKIKELTSSDLRGDQPIFVEHGSMSAAESKAIWKRVDAEQEARLWGPPSAIPEDEVHEEWIDVSVDPE